MIFEILKSVLSMDARRGGGARVGGRPLENKTCFLLYGGFFITFSRCGGLFATFFLLVGNLFHRLETLLLFFHVGAFARFCPDGGGGGEDCLPCGGLFATFYFMYVVFFGLAPHPYENYQAPLVHNCI